MLSEKEQKCLMIWNDPAEAAFSVMTVHLD